MPKKGKIKKEFQVKKTEENVEEPAELEALRQENEALRAELVSRMGNNFQVMLSLLDMARRRIEDAQAIQVFDSLTDKVYAMSLVHMEVFKNRRLDKIEMDQVLEQLVQYLVQQYGKPGVSCSLKADPVKLPHEQAIALSVAMNELIANAFIHGFSRDVRGRVEVILRMDYDGMVEALVRDRGKGMPKEYDIHNPHTLGLKLVHDIAVKQLQGKLRVYRRNGTYMKVSFNPVLFSRQAA